MGASRAECRVGHRWRKQTGTDRGKCLGFRPSHRLRSFPTGGENRSECSTRPMILVTNRIERCMIELSLRSLWIVPIRALGQAVFRDHERTSLELGQAVEANCRD